MITRSVKSFWQRHLRSVGLAIKCEELQDKTVQWAHDAIEQEVTKPSQTHIVLFNSHEPALALKFLESGFPGVSLIESNMKMANRQRSRIAHFLSSGPTDKKCGFSARKSEEN
ncbi:unnamed protein product [Bursaphelenchus xylophilus]|uniref:(pine wood nematode) hypothetical protein n=1 Tax=Bursaphelenchus xylophilus TaxID=6326 RepID=A0A811LVT5_BURXY|nr:unnamed protein product [Bursaphelenchus xylophilus]CAG9125055.1 unnamed protein product [Bursaphelenchus xylophilus]